MVVESNPANISCFPRRLQCNTFHLPRRLQDVFAIRFPKTSSRCLQDVFKTCLQEVLQLCLQTSSRRLGRQKNVTLTTSSRCLQDVFSTSSPRRMFAGVFLDVKQRSCDKTLKFIRNYNINELIIVFFQIGFTRNKFELLKEKTKGNVDMLIIFETKRIGDTFSHSQFLTKIFSTPYRLDQEDFVLHEIWRNSIHLFAVLWNGHLVNYISLMHCYGINTSLLLLTFSRAKF